MTLFIAAESRLQICRQTEQGDDDGEMVMDIGLVISATTLVVYHGRIGIFYILAELDSH